MRRYLPSLTALLTFEACARLLSFTRAAEELGVSPAAVSRQIQNLEAYTGQRLFHRLHRRVELSNAGERLFQPVNRGFSEMAAMLAMLRADDQERQVTVGTTGGFAFYWLMPKLGAFSAAWPEITINQVVADEPIDMQHGEADCAVRYGAGRWPHLDSRFLFDDVVYPVCSPDFLERVGAPKSLEELAGHPLFDSRGIEGDQWLDWATWFREAGHSIGGARGKFLNYLISVQMALEGRGYVLGWHQFVGDLVREGRLVRPLDVEIRSPGAFYLTTPAGRPMSADIQLFADWLIAEAAAVV
ncbi:LysR substrate-binding domain-containing protein [Thalassospiraceae bacterium LMO-JJ14]|nr:LysR substrate-binding domain-containing protein [Thalassospiraceae bacterium LMO-JJ14]